MFNPDRLKMARHRRKLSGKALAELARLTPVTISKVENGHAPEETTLNAIASALQYPIDYFFLESPDQLETDTVSFRSLSKMTAAEKHAALASGTLGIELYEWIGSRFNLPEPDLIDLSKERSRPEVAARMLRQHWGLGDRPIGNILMLLEAKGVRVLSLSENTYNVDAYSFWKGDFPYVFLNQQKTAERSIFDSVHELAHLVLHHHSGPENEKTAETQADKFASAFLMPAADLKVHARNIRTCRQVISAKSRWKVSAMALARRLKDFGWLSEWQLRTLYIELGQLGYRTGEPVGVEREKSTIIAKVLAALWSEKQSKNNIANDLCVPLDEIENLIFNLAGSFGDPMTNNKFEVIDGGKA